MMETFTNLPSQLLHTARQRGDAVALGEVVEGRWVDTSWSQVGRAVEGLAASLIRLGVQPQERVVIWGQNSTRWLLSDLAVIMAGAVTVPVYATNTAAQAEHIRRETEARVAFLDPAQYQAARAEWRAEGSSLKAVV